MSILLNCAQAHVSFTRKVKAFLLQLCILSNEYLKYINCSIIEGRYLVYTDVNAVRKLDLDECRILIPEIT